MVPAAGSCSFQSCRLQSYRYAQQSLQCSIHLLRMAENHRSTNRIVSTLSFTVCCSRFEQGNKSTAFLMVEVPRVPCIVPLWPEVPSDNVVMTCVDGDRADPTCFRSSQEENNNDFI